MLEWVLTLPLKILWWTEVAVGLGLIIFIHEFGHFIMAKRNGVKVEIFSLGFGKAIWKRAWGETEYRIAWLPLGGYVKMAGETIMDERTGDPREFTSKGAWARFEIFAAGVIMNLLIAFPLSMLTYAVGKKEMTNEVAVPGNAECRGGMKPGDVIVEVDGRPIGNLEKFRIEMIRRSVGTPVKVKVLRDGVEKELAIEATASSRRGTLPAALRIGRVTPGSPAALGGLEEGDEIFEAAGERIYALNRLEDILRTKPDEDVGIRWRRKDGGWKVVKEGQAWFRAPGKKVWVLPDASLLCPAILNPVDRSSPVHGILAEDDRIVSVDGRPIASWQDLMDVVSPLAVDTSREVPVKFVRGGMEREAKLRPIYIESNRGGLGLPVRLTNVFGRVPAGSIWERAGIVAGDEVTKVAPVRDGKGGWDEKGYHGKDTPLLHLLTKMRLPEKRRFTLQVQRAGQEKSFAVDTEESVEGDLSGLGLEMEGGRIAMSAQAHRSWTAREAFSAGLYEPFDIAIMTFEVLRKLVTGQEDLSGMSGPVGIVQASFMMAELSFGNFLWLMVLITVNLGVFNILPVPLLDGGQVLLLLLEVLRGRPPSRGFVIGFQYVGVFLLLGLLVLVTVNDVSRLVQRFGG